MPNAIPTVLSSQDYTTQEAALPNRDPNLESGELCAGEWLLFYCETPASQIAS